VDALDIARVMRQRWVLTAATGLLLAVLVGVAAFLVPQQYKVTAIGLVTPASNASVQNPYATADRSQSQVAALLVTVLSAPQTMAGYTDSGATGSIQVTGGNGATDTAQTDSAFITITVTDSSPTGAVHTAQIVRERAVSELRDRQDALRVDPAQRLALTEVLPTTGVTTTRAAQVRAVGLTAALGAVLGVLGIVLADRVLRHRESRRADGVEAPAAATTGDGGSRGRGRAPRRKADALAGITGEPR